MASGAHLRPLLFFPPCSPLIISKQGFATSVSPINLNSLSQMWAARVLHCVYGMPSFPVFFFFFLPSFCFVAAVSSVIRPVCVTCVDLMRCLLCLPTLLNRRPHTLLCLSYNKWGKTHPVCFQREMQCVGRKDRLGIPTAAGWMMSSHPHLTSLVVFPHVERPTVHAHICTHKHI